MFTIYMAAALSAGSACHYEGPPRHAPVEFPLSDNPLSGHSETDGLEQVMARAELAFANAAIAVAVSYPGGKVWSRTSGADDAALFQWASVGKTFTASAVMQLAEEGALSLEDPISAFVPGVPNGDVATIRDLLGHTAGLPNVQALVALKRAKRPETLEEEMTLLREAGPLNCPGGDFAYSNSGYAILAKVLERVTGRPWREVIAQRTIVPLELDRLIVVDDTGSGRGDKRIVEARPAQGEPLPVDAPGAAGPIAGTAHDMVRFWRDFLAGKVVSQDSLDLMFEYLHPFPDGDNYYGLGVQLFDLDPPGGESYYLGHLGGMPGINTAVIYSPEEDIVVAVAVSGDAPAAAISAQLLRAASGDETTPAS
ncbi:serine hydrolase domain-containing protein [Erythrobacter sp.]|jgi:D-alanyl-D-alanine carboxypeptidase|uniref:serine hydrolase domain-containing protein n=1 Tax=Erythrobacter sp. TaxID=1042 RepID=UPI002E9D8442|nr:serine hydrolase domain-containing protein [Erythrobacter sp.]